MMKRLLTILTILIVVAGCGEEKPIESRTIRNNEIRITEYNYQYEYDFPDSPFFESLDSALLSPNDAHQLFFT